MRLIGMPDSGPEGDTFSSEPLEDFLSSYDTFDYVATPSATYSRSMARMLHYSSGKKGYVSNLKDDSTRIKFIAEESTMIVLLQTLCQQKMMK